MKITVITATWNSQSTISDTLSSINGQTYEQIEYIVIDGASSDRTLDIVEHEGTRVSKLISEKDGGIYDALNKGLEVATGDVIGFLHSDDVFASANVLELVAKAFDDKSVDAVYGDLDYVRKADPSKIVRRWVSGEYERSRFRYGWMPPHPTFYMRREHYRRLKGFDLTYRIAADYDSLLRYLWGAQLNAAYIPEVLIKMRVGGESNKNLANIIRKTKEDRRAMVENGLGPVLGLIGKNLSKVPQFLKR